MDKCQLLTPSKVKQIATKQDEYAFTPVDLMVDSAIKAGRRYEEQDLNKIIEVRERLAAHETIDQPVAVACGWSDYTPQ